MKIDRSSPGYLYDLGAKASAPREHRPSYLRFYVRMATHRMKYNGTELESHL